jgi:capsule polysaccharide export protein KpsE/RkpR
MSVEKLLIYKHAEDRVAKAEKNLKEWWNDYMLYGGKEECAIKCKEGVTKWEKELAEARKNLEALKDLQPWKDE